MQHGLATIGCGEGFTIFINENNEVYSCGTNDCKQLGRSTNNSELQRISSLVNIKTVSCGFYHSVCVDMDGNVYSFGRNYYEQLGVSNVRETHIPQKVNVPPTDYVCCGGNFTICVSNQMLYSFGCNLKGQLGIGKLEDGKSAIPTLISDLPNEVELLACGEAHVVCKTIKGDIYVWGDDRFGQIGQSVENTYLPTYFSFEHSKDIISIKCGFSHTLLLLLDGKVYTFGFNSNGRLGLGDYKSTRVSSPILIKDLPQIKKISCDNIGSRCIDIDNKLWVFGSNSYAQLGLEGGGLKNSPTLISALKNNVFDVSHKGSQVFVKTINNEIYFCGQNKRKESGELGVVHCETLTQIFKGKEDIWKTIIQNSRQKSARK